jgi:predicted small secreted protein
MKTMILKMITGISLVVIVCAISGCNTMRGLGTDIERAGQKMQRVGK